MLSCWNLPGDTSVSLERPWTKKTRMLNICQIVSKNRPPGLRQNLSPGRGNTTRKQQNWDPAQLPLLYGLWICNTITVITHMKLLSVFMSTSVRLQALKSLVVLNRVFGAHLSAAAEDEAGQKSLCGSVSYWTGAANSEPPHSLCCGLGSCFEDRNLQSQAAWLRILSPQQCSLVSGQHREEHWLHAAGPGSGKDLR